MKRKKNRRTGNASHSCSACGSVTRVLRTWRGESGEVVRHRRCTTCKTEQWTKELSCEKVKPPTSWATARPAV